MLGYLPDWLVPDCLENWRNPLAGLKPDVAGVQMSKRKIHCKSIVSALEHRQRAPWSCDHLIRSAKTFIPESKTDLTAP